MLPAQAHCGLTRERIQEMIDATMAHRNGLHCFLPTRWLRQTDTTAPVPSPAYPPGIIPVKAHQHIEAIHNDVFHPHGNLTTTSRSSMVRAVPHPHGTRQMLLFLTCYYSLILSRICKNEYAIYRSPSLYWLLGSSVRERASWAFTARLFFVVR